MHASSVPLTRQAIEELKAIHQKESGEDLSDDEAWAMGERLLRFLDVVTRPDSVRVDILRSSSPVGFDRSRE